MQHSGQLRGNPTAFAATPPKFHDYVHPKEVLAADKLTLSEKRAILAAWASDASAVESRPGFRWLPGTPGPIALDHVRAAMRALDRETWKAASSLAWNKGGCQ